MGHRLKLIAVAFVLILGIVFWQAYLVEPAKDKDAEVMKFGGDINLISQDSEPFSLSSISGSYSVLFFGFTHCPDVCPVGLQKISSVIKSLPEQLQGKIKVLFITVDPQRDTASVMKEYLKSFELPIIGLTGTPEQIADVTKRYAIYSEKIATTAHDHAGHEHTGHEEHDASDQRTDDYMVNHTSHFILLNKNGDLVKLYSADQKPEDMIRDLSLIMLGGE